jgi:hypothetical protein
MATTTNYSFPTPDDTDLVKDGASAIRSFGTAVDTQIKDLNPGTTAGDIDYYTTSTAKARIGIGTAGQVLTVNSGATAPEWGAPPAAGADWSLLNAGGTSLTGATTITVSGISAKDKIMILIQNASSVNTAATFGVRLNTDTGSNYTIHGIENEILSTYNNNNFYNISSTSTLIPIGKMGTNNTQEVSGFCLLTGCNAAGVKVFNSAGSGGKFGNNQKQFIGGGFYNSATVISSISLFSDNGNFDGGTVFVYTSA